jgi:RNA ligase
MRKLTTAEWNGIQDCISQGTIRMQVHPKDPDLAIFNYTHLAMVTKDWNPYVMMSRGLIVRLTTLEVVARPFKKFFNYEELSLDTVKKIKIGGEIPVVSDKLDGSLGVSYFYETSYAIKIATRGSFDSNQAKWANKYIQQGIKWEEYHEFVQIMKKGYTLLFEIICPENRIVVDYKGKSGLVLVGIVNIDTGEEHPPRDFEKQLHPSTEVAKEFNPFMEPTQRDNAEGVVFHYHNLQIKYKRKQQDYVDAHRLRFETTPKTIWEALKGGLTGEEVVGLALEDMRPDVRSVVDGICSKRDEIAGYATAIVDDAVSQNFETRKELALFFKKAVVGVDDLGIESPFSVVPLGVLFSYHDNHNMDNADHIIWKAVQPRRGEYDWDEDL